ncbi:oxidoreductase [Spirosoma sp. KNUC1025]|uniref:oxidoreductase n=1 Tax=Spirosoma sp. KNUC1025 TaxID=2894082 RepID=UPI001E3CE126|nr:oxidoreductase [Spirosoma sp. KNUC1025]UFH57500.1 SDR family NAD(P)-dependent oxidoreductase [Spirosoma sp. KNUC1025]
MWTTENMPDLSGKTAIITGANTGIGYQTAKAFYEAGANVTIAVRDAQKAKTAIEQIRQGSFGTGTLETGLLNLASLHQVKEFAENYKRHHQHLDILVNNAGVMIPPPTKTDDGFEMQFGVNFMGHFALTGHLFPLLKNTPKARVVTLSSGAATRASGIDFTNLKLEQPYEPWREYAVSKLADILFTYELDRRLKVIQSTILSVAAHPGVTRTDLQRHIPSEELSGMFAQFDDVMEPWQGALPTLFAATDASVKGGEFYGPNGDKEYAGYPARSNHSTPAMNDKALAKQLWDYAESITQINFPV